MNPFWWLLISVVFYAAGEYYSKKWSEDSTHTNLALLLIAYMTGVCLWLPALKETRTLALTGMLWLLLSIITTIALGVAVFGEKLTVFNWIGVGLAIVACILLSLK